MCLSDRWSNCRTLWSVMPQSVHLPWRRLYRSTNALFLLRWYLFCATRVCGFSLYHLAEPAAEHFLQDDCSPSVLRLFLEYSAVCFTSRHTEQGLELLSGDVIEEVVIVACSPFVVAFTVILLHVQFIVWYFTKWVGHHAWLCP